jgi:hypothetical protein
MQPFPPLRVGLRDRYASAVETGEAYSRALELARRSPGRARHDYPGDDDEDDFNQQNNADQVIE